MKVQLLSIALVNFKGIAQMEIKFNESGDTTISGDNGTGKTTVFDAFTWLLFGKDSLGRSDSNFSIKTIDSDTGRFIPRLEHSVTAVLSIDGNQKKLQRCYCERWGTDDDGNEKLMNHESKFYINDVRCGTKKEYDTFVSSIISEELFRMITDPMYFNTLKAEDQKTILFDMSGTVTDEEVALTNPEYDALLKEMAGTSVSKFAAEVAARKREAKKVLDIVPEQIKTARKLCPQPEDWNALQAQIDTAQAKIAEYDAQIIDRSKAEDAETQRKVSLQKQIGDLRIAIANRGNDIRNTALAGRNEALLQVRDLEYSLNSATADLHRKENELKKKDGEIAEADRELAALREQFRAISSEQLSFPEGAFVCPTCKRPLEVEDIENKQRELTNNFNESKASRLKANKEKGMGKKVFKDTLLSERSQIQESVGVLSQQIESLSQQIESRRASVPEAPDVESIASRDEQIAGYRAQIAELEKSMNAEGGSSVDISDITSAKNELLADIKSLSGRLKLRDKIAEDEKEIAELSEKESRARLVAADSKRLEDVINNFRRDKDKLLTERINGLFRFVSFSFISEQLNGDVKVTCTCTVNGTPFKDANNASRINAGIDIINAICRARNISAPIFIDNREGVNEILPTLSQVINLVVSNDKSLTVK